MVNSFGQPNLGLLDWGLVVGEALGKALAWKGRGLWKGKAKEPRKVFGIGWFFKPRQALGGLKKDYKLSDLKVWF